MNKVGTHLKAVPVQSGGLSIIRYTIGDNLEDGSSAETDVCKEDQ